MNDFKTSLPTAGAAATEVCQEAHAQWIEKARRFGIDVSRFDPAASFEERLTWVASKGLAIGTALSRFSSKLQHSTQSQVMEIVAAAAARGIYVPPELICVDEGVSGRKSRRDGLDRMRLILDRGLAKVLLVFKVSRLFRSAYKGYQLFQEELVEEGRRGISISQGIDTDDKAVWKSMCVLHGLMDEMLLTTIADHVRSGIKTLFEKGYVTGALTVGYKAVEVTGGMPTNLGKARTMPAVDPTVAPLIRQHFEWIRDGMPIKEGWRRWVKDGGPCDPRSTMGRMSYPSYRRMLSNPRYQGKWAFGRKRNEWSSKKDYTQQVTQPDSKVVFVSSDDLRIVDDSLFLQVQERLATLKSGPRGPKKQKALQLWDMVTECFVCYRCGVRFYQAGANGHGMCCKNGDLCPCKTVVRRKEAVSEVARSLGELLLKASRLKEDIVIKAQEIDGQEDDSLKAEAESLSRKIQFLNARIKALIEFAGAGTEEECAEWRAGAKEAQTERTAVQRRLAQVEAQLGRDRSPIQPEQVQSILEEFALLMKNGADGTLGQDVVYKAASIFKTLVGGEIQVHVEPRASRKRTQVTGFFTPRILHSLHQSLEMESGISMPESEKVTVWLRKPPRADLLAEKIHELVDVQGLTYDEASIALREFGEFILPGVVWQIYQRYYEMRGETPPKKPYNNGKSRRPRSA